MAAEGASTVGRLLVALLLIAAFCLGVAFSYYNWTAVNFHYLAGEAELPLIALLLTSFVLGVVVTWLLMLARTFVMSRESRRLQRQIRELESELKSLRNLPLQGQAGSATAGTPSIAPPPPNA